MHQRVRHVAHRPQDAPHVVKLRLYALNMLHEIFRRVRRHAHVLKGFQLGAGFLKHDEIGIDDNVQ